MAGGGRRRTRPGPRRGPRDRGDPRGGGLRRRPPGGAHARPLLHLVPALAHVSVKRGPTVRLSFRGAAAPRALARPPTPPIVGRTHDLERSEHGQGRVRRRRDPAGGRGPAPHARAAGPARTVRRTRGRDPRRGDRRPPDRSRRRPRDGHGGRRQLQQRLGRSRVPVDVTKTQALGRAHRLPHRRLGRRGCRASRSATRDERARGRPGRRPRRPVGPRGPVGDRGNDPGLAPSFRVWGYDTCWGSFAQFTKVQAHQCLPKAEPLTGGGGGADAHRRDGVPDAPRLAAEHREAGRRRARLGRASGASDRWRFSS